MNTKQQLKDSVNDIVHEIESEDFDAYEWANEQLSVECVMRRPDGSFLGVEIAVTIGGPNIFVDTRENTVSGYWGGDQVERTYRDEGRLCQATEEMFNY